VDPPLSNQHFSGGERQSRNTGLLVGLTLSIAGLLLAAGFAILSKWHSRYWVRSQHHNSEDPEVLRPSWQLTAFKTLQFSLEEVVNNLESYSIIGKGKSGHDLFCSLTFDSSFTKHFFLDADCNLVNRQRIFPHIGKIL
jgi:hypothetical protein